MQELEQQSRYQHLALGVSPNVMRHRIVTLRSGAYHVLSRLQDSGTDYSKRNNHIAHHLVFAQEETVGLPNPASILINWSGWREGWEEPPRVLGPDEAFDLDEVDTRKHPNENQVTLPAALAGGRPLKRVFELSPGEESWLSEHYRRSLNALPVRDQWRYSFTNALLPTDQPGDYVWSGAWRGLPLPFELDFQPRPLEQDRVAAKPAEGDREPTAESEPGDSEAASAKRKYGVPVVEIPEAYDRRKRRRPKRKFGRRELARSINLALAASALLAVAVLAFWIYRNHEEVDVLIEERRNNAERPLTDFTQRDYEAWQAFEEDGYPPRLLDEATATAIRLAGIGEDAPLRVTRFLQALAANPPIDWSSRLRAPRELVARDGAAFRLALSNTQYPRVARLALAPERLLDLAASSRLDQSDPAALFSGLEGGVYSTRLFQQSLERHLEGTRKRLLPGNSQRIQAIENFLSLKTEILQDPRFRILLQLRDAFGLPESADYFAFGSNGLLQDKGPRLYQRYLVNLFSDYVLAHYNDFRNTAEFQAAVTHVGSQDFSNASEAATAIFDAISLGRPATSELSAEWQRISEAWRKAFVRSDLMEQALVGYTLEAFESGRQTLLDLQERFTASDMARYQRYVDVQSELTSLARAARSLSPPNEWIVFEAQSPN